MSLLENLTGEARGKFFFWYKKKQQPKCLTEMPSFKDFKKLNPSMQIGVLIDWAESEGYFLDVFTAPIIKITEAPLFCVSIDFEGADLFGLKNFKTRHEAYEASVKKLNEIINNK